MNILIENAVIVPMDREEGDKLSFNGSLGISGKKIVLVGEDGKGADDFKRRCGDDLKIIDARGKLVMPGLVNIHNHAPMTLMRSYADDMPLMKWLNDYVWPFEPKLTREKIVTGAELAIAEMLLGGTTTFVDMYWMEEAVGETVERSGIRAVLCPSMIDFKMEDFDADLKECIERYDKGQCDRITLMIAPHSPYSCSEESLLKAKTLAERYGIGINIHLAESLDESRTIEERYGKSPVEFICDLGLLNDKSIAVHCVQLSDSDIELLASTGASVAHNPQSNMKIGNGVSPVEKMCSAGINVGFGTDGPCSNNDLDMWEEMRTASFLQKCSLADPCAMPAYRTLRMATVAGAEAIGKAGELGVLKEGAIADVLIVDITKPHLYPHNDIIANLVYAGKSSDVESVIINGEMVVENRRLLTMDFNKIIDKLNRTT